MPRHRGLGGGHAAAALAAREAQVEQMQKAWARIVAKAWADGAYKARLLENAGAVLQAEGLVLPTGAAVRVVEAAPDELLFVLPPRPSASGGPAAEEERISPIV